MNYAEAKERLETPRNKESKILRTKLELRKEVVTPSGEIRYTLNYFATDVLTWTEDGRVCIRDGGFLASRFTRDTINEFLPKGWRLETFPLAFDKEQFVATVGDHHWDGESWKSTWSYPYSPESWYSPKGAAHITDTRYQNARELKTEVAVYVRKTVEQFLRGEVSHADAQMDIWTDYTRDESESQEGIALSILRGNFIRPATFMLLLFLKHWNAADRALAASHWAEYFKYTTWKEGGSKRFLAERIAFEMCHEDTVKRPPRSSEVFRSLRSKLLATGEEMLLEDLGFTLYKKESFPNHTNGYQ